eukprot:TRINITY_DN2699_c0_g3_i4.p1 TRINITY_DN2699_c0_g3~~TRINITY_DN2699_c0_g3_i4.p1  ORF type:complete len:205 (+),score=37.23 TRINITY_DN2699_c0_g3_i4:73-615(+)
MTTIDVPMLFCSRPFVVQFDTCVPHQLTNRVDPHRYSQTIQGANEIYTENSYRWISLVYIVVAIALFVGMAFLIVNDSTPVFIIPTVYVAITIPFVCFEIYKRRKLYSLLGVYFATENLHYQQNGLSFIFHSHAFCGDRKQWYQRRVRGHWVFSLPQRISNINRTGFPLFIIHMPFAETV